VLHPREIRGSKAMNKDFLPVLQHFILQWDIYGAQKTILEKAL